VSALLFLVSLPLAAVVVRTINESTAETEGEIKVEDLHIEGVALPAGHHTAGSEKADVEDGYEKGEKGSEYYAATVEVQK
jgi:hypothetical protein